MFCKFAVLLLATSTLLSAIPTLALDNTDVATVHIPANDATAPAAAPANADSDADSDAPSQADADAAAAAASDDSDDDSSDAADDAAGDDSGDASDDPAAAVVATPSPSKVFNTKAHKCNVGKLECCKSLQQANSKSNQNQSGLINIGISAIQALVGVQCTPIDILIGIGAGSNCNATPACCKRNTSNGVVTVSCVPINANL